MRPFEELLEISRKLKNMGLTIENGELSESIMRLKQASEQVSASFSGSWQGYHSRVYYSDFNRPPAGAHFSQEWGLMGTYGSRLGSRGDWVEYDPEAVKSYIRQIAGDPDLGNADAEAESARRQFDLLKSDMISILQGELEGGEDAFLNKLLEELNNMHPLTSREIAERISPKGQYMTRDTVVIGQGKQIPPHTEVLCQISEIELSFKICDRASVIALKAGSHLERKYKKMKVDERIGTNVFIGHGRSHLWKDLKDFIQDRMGLPWDEFNRVPVAGVTNIARLSEMLDSAAIAFLVMTAEDEQASGSVHARMNVIHEAGLFQGRLGFHKAIILLEDGCEQFSNIDGLGQIRFPKGNIRAIFEEIRQLLERESLV